MQGIDIMGGESNSPSGLEVAIITDDSNENRIGRPASKPKKYTIDSLNRRSWSSTSCRNFTRKESQDKNIGV
jgi:hypothetical protein